MAITASTLSNDTMTVIVDGAKILTATKDHPKWVELVNAFTRKDESTMLDLLSMKRVIEKFSCGGLTVSDQGVFYKDMPLAGVDVDRVMAFMLQGLPYEPIAQYMGRKFLNPSKRAITEMYNFLEHRQMPLTPEGRIIAYKGVQKDFFSGRGGSEPLSQGRRNEKGQIFNGVGETIQMERSFVDDDFRQDCSGGLHAGSLSYAKDYAHGLPGGIVILIEIDPADVVSVPADCNCKKLRCCKYRVISVYDGPLPDTYTSDYSEQPVTDGVNDSPPENEDEDDGWNETCNECGENVDNCICEEELPTSNVLPETLVPASPAAPLFYDPSVRQRAVALICEQLGVKLEDVKDESTFTDLGADSLDQVELAMAVEEEFNFEVTDEEAERCDTVGKLIHELNIKIAGRSLFAPPPVAPTPEPVVSEPVPEKVVVTENSDAAYHEGYKLGGRNGTRRVKRLYHQGDENVSYADHSAEFIRGYNAGYRNARWDYTS